jgi:hypothetical protein
MGGVLMSTTFSSFQRGPPAVPKWSPVTDSWMLYCHTAIVGFRLPAQKVFNGQTG